MRFGKGLDFDKSLAMIKVAAERREFLSYTLKGFVAAARSLEVPITTSEEIF